MWLSFAQSYRHIRFQALELFLIAGRKDQLFEMLQTQIRYFFRFLCLFCCTLEQGLEALYWVKLVFIVNCIYSCCAVTYISENALISWGSFTSNYCLWTKLSRPLTKKTLAGTNVSRYSFRSPAQLLKSQDVISRYIPALVTMINFKIFKIRIMQKSCKSM